MIVELFNRLHYHSIASRFCSRLAPATARLNTIANSYIMRPLRYNIGQCQVIFPTIRDCITQ